MPTLNVNGSSHDVEPAEKAKDALSRNCKPCHNPERPDSGINYMNDSPL